MEYGKCENVVEEFIVFVRYSKGHCTSCLCIQVCGVFVVWFESIKYEEDKINRIFLSQFLFLFRFLSVSCAHIRSHFGFGFFPAALRH